MNIFGANSKMDSANSGRVGFSSSIPSVRQQDHDTKPFGLWNTDTPRKLVDSADWDREEDLQGLVSNILEEADPEDVRYNGGILPTGYSIWSPTTAKEDHLKGFQSEAKPLPIPPISQNYIVHQPFGKTELQPLGEDVENLSQLANGFVANQHWPFNQPNRNNHFSSSQKLPPGLPLPNTGNAYPSQIQQNHFTNGTGYFDDTGDIFEPQNDLNRSCSDLFYDAYYKQNNKKATCNDYNLPNDFDQLVSSLHSLMPPDHNTGCLGELSNLQTVALENEESIAEHWKIINSAMLAQSTPGMPFPKQFVEEFGRGLKKQNGEVMKQSYKRNAFQDDFQARNAVYFQQAKPCSTVKFNNYQNKTAKHREKDNVSMNPYLKSQIQQSQFQNNKAPVQRQKQRIPMPPFLGDDLSRRPPTKPNPYWNMQSQRLDGKNTIGRSGNAQQFMPLNNPVNYMRRHSNMHFNSSFRSRSPLPNDNSLRSPNVGNVSASGTASFNSRVSDLRACGGCGLCPDVKTSIPAQMSQSETVIPFPNYLEECFKQCRSLEEERKLAESFIMKSACGKKAAVVTVSDRPKNPQNQTQVEQLIVNQKKEQAKVSSLLNKIECEYNMSLHIGIHTALSRHQMAVCVLQSRSQEDVSTTGRQQSFSYLPLNKDAMLMNIALKEVVAATRKLRTALYSALQMIMPKPAQTLDNHVINDGKCAERRGSPGEDSSFEILKASMS